MLNGLDLFSGIGSMSKALEPWARTVAYCEKDPRSQQMLLCEMRQGYLDRAPIWDDVSTLRGSMLPAIDIVFGGFPCTNISLAGNRDGLAGQQSGLFFEIARLAIETKAPFIFIENVWPGVKKHVPIITSTLERLGYVCRDGFLAAQDAGASHRRERWFLVAYSSRFAMRMAAGRGRGQEGKDPLYASLPLETWNDSHSHFARVAKCRPEIGHESKQPFSLGLLEGDSWDEYASFFLRMDSGLPYRADRIRALGNTNPVIQYQEAFKILMGLKEKPNA